MHVNEVPAATGRCLSKVVVDVTSPSATTDVDLQTATKGPPGAVATAHELDKVTRTTDANVAAVNGFEHMPVAIEKDSLALGPETGTLVKRTSRNREGESFDEELERLHGFRDGTWSAPVADRFWRVWLVVSVVSARERAVDDFIQGTEAWAGRLLQSRWGCLPSVMHVVVGCSSMHDKLGLACSSFIIVVVVVVDEIEKSKIERQFEEKNGHAAERRRSWS